MAAFCDGMIEIAAHYGEFGRCTSAGELDKSATAKARGEAAVSGTAAVLAAIDDPRVPIAAQILAPHRSHRMAGPSAVHRHSLSDGLCVAEAVANLEERGAWIRS